MTQYQYDPMPPGKPPKPVDPTLPDWVPPTQNNNPSRNDVNSVGSSLGARTLTLSPHGTYVPVVFGEDYVGPIISLIYENGPYLYLRLVWCVGEIESIEQVTLSDGKPAPQAVWTHYTGTPGQGIDPTLQSRVIGGYTDTLTNIGPDNLNIAYSVVRILKSAYDSFPRFRAKIKGLKMKSPVPNITSYEAGHGGVGETLTVDGRVITATDTINDGKIEPHIRYGVNTLIDNDEYTFRIEVLEFNNQGAGNAIPYFAGVRLKDSGGVNLTITGVGTFEGKAKRATYTGTWNALKLTVASSDNGVQLKYRVTAWNSLGNEVFAYSDTAGIALNHLYTDPKIGLGLKTNFESYVELIHRNQEVLDTTGYSEIRSRIGLTLNQKRPIDQVLETLRGYARTNVANNNGEFVYFPMMPMAETFTITNSELQPNTFKPEIKDIRNVPNFVRIYYTDKFQSEIRENFVEVASPDFTSGLEHKREAVYRMNGFASRPAALRYGYDIINQRLRQFAVKFRSKQALYDKSEGETFTLNVKQLGNNPYKMKLFAKRKVGATEYEAYAEHEDDNIYSNEIADYDPGSPTLPGGDPYTVQPATGLVLSMEEPEFQTGIYMSRLRATWTKTIYGYNHYYKVLLTEKVSGLLIDEKQVSAPVAEVVFNNIQENVQYEVTLTVIGFGASESSPISGLITPAGKDFPPTDVPNFNAASVYGHIRLTWDNALDNKSIWYYKLQYGPKGFNWDGINHIVLIKRVDGFEYVTQLVPPGEWDFLIKAVDNAGNESVNASRDSGVIPSSLDPWRTVNEATDLNILRTLNTGIVGYTPYAKQPSDRVIYQATGTAMPEKFEATPYSVPQDVATRQTNSFSTTFGGAAMSTYTNPYLSYGTSYGTEYFIYIKELEAPGNKVLPGLTKYDAEVSFTFQNKSGDGKYYPIHGENDARISAGDLVTHVSGPAPQLGIIQVNTSGDTFVPGVNTTKFDGTKAIYAVKIPIGCRAIVHAFVGRTVLKVDYIDKTYIDVPFSFGDSVYEINLPRTGNYIDRQAFYLTAVTGGLVDDYRIETEIEPENPDDDPNYWRYEKIKFRLYNSADVEITGGVNFTVSGQVRYS